MWYSIEMFVELLSIAASIWVLYHTDYAPVMCVCVCVCVCARAYV